MLILSRYRALIPKARLIPLPPAFIDYLRADGIVLPPETDESPDATEPSEWDDADESEDPSQDWAETHTQIKNVVAELGGSVMPKLNWSAPKDATWISATNSMECKSANDIYLLLKSSDFVTHDLEQAFHDCVDDIYPSQGFQELVEKIPYHLVLRKTVPLFNQAVEFRCFVRDRVLLCLCQREMTHFDFLPQLVPSLRRLIQEFFELRLAEIFPDPNFTFDVYVPAPHDRVWLIDINPWAPRTDPLLFSWLEILEMSAPARPEGTLSRDMADLQVSEAVSNTDSEAESDESEENFVPEFRLIKRDDPEAYSFSTAQYSAHKLPRDVVDASSDGGVGLREFMGRWKDVVDNQEREREETVE